MEKHSHHEHDELLARFVCAIEKLAMGSREDLATKQDLLRLEKILMSAIEDFANKVDTAFDEISTAVDGVVTDVQWLKDKITELQNSAGQITPEDQARLDALEARAATAVTKVKALDAATEIPPTP